MKKLILLSIFLICVACKLDRNPLAKNNNSDNIQINLVNVKDLTPGNLFYYRNEQDGQVNYEIHQVEGDTLINGTIYAEIKILVFDDKFNFTGDTYVYFQRASETQLFQLKLHVLPLRETLIFDLNWQIGQNKVTAKGDTSLWGLQVKYIEKTNTYSNPDMNETIVTKEWYFQYFGKVKFVDQIYSDLGLSNWTIQLLACKIQGRIFGDADLVTRFKM